MLQKASTAEDAHSSPGSSASELDILLKNIRAAGSVDKTSPSLGPLRVPTSAAALAQLPEEVRSIDAAMTPAIKEAPMRLLLVEAVLSWPQLKVFEEVQAGECLDVPYSEVGDAVWHGCAVLSWRWGHHKPREHQPGFSPMTREQWVLFLELLRAAQADGVTYTWVDWSCVPQYSADSIIEVLRSKVFYARARVMVVLPTICAIPDKGIVRVLLAQVGWVLKGREGASSAAAVAAAILEAVLARDRIASHEYFGRVWTLAERMARHGRSEPLCNWLSLEAWLGMVLSAVLAAVEDRGVLEMYGKLLGGLAAEQLGALMSPLAAAVGKGMVDDGLKEQLADVCEAAVAAWLRPQGGGQQGGLVEAPTRDWLRTYLGPEACSGAYAAWDQADRVWAVYTFFSWRPISKRTPEALRAALEDLVEHVGGDPGGEIRTKGMFVQLQLEDGEGGLTPLHRAALANRVEVVREMLASGQDVEARDRDGCTALLLASSSGHVGVVQLLLAAGADRDSRDTAGRTPLVAASFGGHGGVVEALLAAGADKGARDKTGQTALHWAAANGHAEVAAALLAAGADEDAAGGDEGRTPLQLASAAGRYQLVKMLLDSGAMWQRRDKKGQTALQVAGSEAVSALLEGVRREALAALAEPVRQLAAGEDPKLLELQRLLLDGADEQRVATDGDRLLLGFCSSGHTEAVRLLLAAGASPEAKDKKGRTPLIQASSDAGRTEVVQLLLAAGADKEVKDMTGQTPLIRASEAGLTEAVQLLLAAGADKDAKDEDGNTALTWASGQGHTEVVQLLLAAGADKEAKDEDGATPLILASKWVCTEVVRLLLAAGADKDAKDKEGKTALDVADDDSVRDLLRSA